MIINHPRPLLSKEGDGYILHPYRSEFFLCFITICSLPREGWGGSSYLHPHLYFQIRYGRMVHLLIAAADGGAVEIVGGAYFGRQRQVR